MIGWTGEEVLVVGGSTYMCPPSADCMGPTESPFRDGAALNPLTAEWRQIADAPLPVSTAPTARLGRDVYFLEVTPSTPGAGERQTTLLRYRSDADTWTAHDVPSAATGGRLVATDAEMVVYPESDEHGETPDLRFSPDDGSWAQLPADPLSPSFDRTYAFDGEDLYLFAKEVTPSPGGASGPALIQAAVLHDDTWAHLGSGEVLGAWDLIVDEDRIVAPMLGCADGGATNNYGRCIPEGGVFDTTTRTWRALPNAPRDRNARSSGAVTDNQLLLTGLGNPMLDLTTDTWFDMPDIDRADDSVTTQRSLAAAGPYGFAFGGARFDPENSRGTLLAEAWLWTPPSRAASSP